MAATVGNAFTVIDCCAVTVPPQPPVMVYIILQVPADTAVTTPVDEFTVAMPVLLLLHAAVPPANTTVLAVYVAVAATHKGVVPDTEATLALVLIVIATGVLVADAQAPSTVQVKIT